eukprot:gnl/MRDRNA2_/MRDRNA2_112164_c0_seq1.p1 gnl/MRDRNA2_/MRDRNA2_112164_c0~~gnl/MRDRNA2_/MRDRNA2_112164_c0_seq1.p1  ORF type:complete len:371 (-),score=40.82 gnl/MRDRNA2_/MRDRNA2_112164_c0_seq1:50-1162(-)
MVAQPSSIRVTIIIVSCFCHLLLHVIAARPNLRSHSLALSQQVQSGHSKQAHAQCPTWHDPAALVLRKHAQQLMPKRRVKRRKSVTLVTQGTLDRLESFQVTLTRWKGPISIVLYARPNVQNDANALRMWAHMNKRRFAAGSSVKLVLDNNISRPYPINVLRNIALGGARTPFVFPLDIDFVPSQDLYHEIVSNLPRIKQAMVVPAFEVTDGNIHLPPPKTKYDLLRRIPRAFHVNKAPFAHKATRSLKWLSESKAKYHIRVDSRTHESYEPYVVVRRKSLPGYDERFMGYGFNKVQWVLCLRCSGYRFTVLGRAFVTHLNHNTLSVHNDPHRKEQHERSDIAMNDFVKELQCPLAKSPAYRNRFFSPGS